MNMQTTVTLINGVESSHVSVADRGLHYGDGLFETIRVEQGGLHYWQQHYNRLAHSAQRLALSCPQQTVLEDDIRHLLRYSQATAAQTAVLKIIITRGAGERGYRFARNLPVTRIVQLDSCTVHKESHGEHGIAATFCQHRLASSAQLAGIKHLNRLDNILASAELGKRWQEGIVLDQQDNVIEGCFSNLFFLRGTCLYTPALRTAGVEGIIRQRLLQLVSDAGLTLCIDHFSRQQLVDADEIFFSNSLIGLWPVRQLDDKMFTSFDQTRKLASLLAQDETQHVTKL